MSDPKKPASGRDVKIDPIAAAVDSVRGTRMIPHEIAWMLAGAVRIPSVSALAASKLDASYFDHSEAGFILLWKGALAAIKSNGGALPLDQTVAKELVAMKCSAELATDTARMFYTPHVENFVFAAGSGILDTIYEFPVSEEIAVNATELLGRFVRERILSDSLKRAMAGIGPHETITDPQVVLDAIEAQARSLIGMDADPGSLAVIEDFVPVGRKAVTTKLKFLDRLMGGGHGDKECYALLGPSSGGKSAIAVQIAMEAAEVEAATAAELGEDQARFWYYFTWELTEQQLRTRIYCYGAKVDMGSFNDLAKHGVPYSTAKNPETLKPYEHEPYVNSPGNPMTGEVERLQALGRRSKGIGANLVIVDYSADRPGHGDNSVDGVAAYLKKEAARGRRIGGVVIDYAKLVVDRYMSAKQLRPENEYKLLSSFGNMVRSKVSIPFSCKSWVLHQLHGSVAKKRFGKLHYSDALGCKNFADNFDFGIEFGMYNENTGLTEFSSSKHRHAAGLADGVIAKFDGRLGVFMDPEQEYVRDPATGQIVPRDFIGQVSAGAAPGYRQAPPVNPFDGID